MTWCRPRFMLPRRCCSPNICCPRSSGCAACSRERAAEFTDVVKTGRTHLMDAMPITLAQELDGWQAQIDEAMARLRSVAPRLHKLAQGGTAVGTGINARPEFGAAFARALAASTGIRFQPQRQLFRGAVEPGYGGGTVRTAQGPGCELS